MKWNQTQSAMEKVNVNRDETPLVYDLQTEHGATEQTSQFKKQTGFEPKPPKG